MSKNKRSISQQDDSQDPKNSGYAEVDPKENEPIGNKTSTQHVPDTSPQKKIKPK